MINSNEFDQAMQIYTQSFPSHERASIPEIQKRIELKDEILFTASEDTQIDNIIAFALFRPFYEKRFILLDYLAVEESYRNHGIGNRFLCSLIEYYALKLAENYDYILIEVDHPDFGINKAENRIRERRIKFYQKIGGILLENIHYLLPSFDPNSKSYSLASETQLIIIPLNLTKDFLKKLINRKLVQEMIQTLYIQLYQQTPDSEIVQTILSEVPDQIKFNCEKK